MINQENQDNYENIEEAQIITDDFSPLDAPVKQRAYTQHKMDSSQSMADLDEPNFDRPSFEDLDGSDSEKGAEPERPFNPSYSELDGKEKTMGAEMMADMTLDIYEKGCFYMGKIPQISESKIDKLIAEGEIDPSIQLQTESGSIPIKDFAVEFNDSIKEAFVVGDEFKEKVKPPLMRVFKKRGVGMTDEQLLAYYFITDLGTKAAQAFMLRKTTTSILDSLKENTLAMRENQANSQMNDNQNKNRNTKESYQEPTVQEDISYTENIAEVLEQPVSRTKAKVKTNARRTNLDEQMEYFDAQEQSVFSNVKDSGFSQDFQNVPGMPNFGDPITLSELEKLNRGAASKPTRQKRSTAVRKPKK